MTRNRTVARCRMAGLALLLLAAAGLSLGSLEQWHRHVFAGIELLHGHSHVGSHDHGHRHEYGYAPPGARAHGEPDGAAPLPESPSDEPRQEPDGVYLGLLAERPAATNDAPPEPSFTIARLAHASHAPEAFSRDILSPAPRGPPS